MNQRATDPKGIRIDTTIPLWGVIGICVTLLGIGIMTWAGQRETALELKSLSISVEKQAVLVERIDTARQARDTKDVQRDSLLSDHERRITRIEAAVEAKR